MKDCRGCESLGMFRGCNKEHKLHYEDGCKKCGVPYNLRIFWDNLMNDKYNECEDFKQKYYSDPSGS